MISRIIFRKVHILITPVYRTTASKNKIFDSTKTFSTQKIAANLARTLAHEVKNPLSGIKGSAQIHSKK